MPETRSKAYDLMANCTATAKLLRHNIVDVRVCAEDFPASQDAVFKLMADPDNHARIFDSIEVSRGWLVENFVMHK